MIERSTQHYDIQHDTNFSAVTCSESLPRGAERKKGKQKKGIKKEKTKQSETNDRCCEECDARRSETKGKKGCNRQRNTIHAEEEQIPVMGAQQHEDNCCCTDKTAR